MTAQGSNKRGQGRGNAPALRPNTRQHTASHNATPPADVPQFASIAAAAQRWDVSTDTVRRLISAGKVTGYRLNGRILRVNVAEVDACFRPIPSAASGAGL